MKRLLFIIPLLISFLASAQDVFKTELFSADMVLKYRDELKLSDAQLSNIKKVYSDDMLAYNSLKWDLDAELVKIGGLLSKVQVDRPASIIQMNKILELESAIKLKRLGLLISIKNELNETQQKKIRKMKASSSSDSFNFITPINENPRVVLKVDGPEVEGQPLYFIVDKSGKRKVESFKDIDKNNIERIDVLKGSSAKKDYGEKGKNGVVLIYLKKKKQ
jgi:hypothetical protein